MVETEPGTDMEPSIEILLRTIDQAFDHRSWHGPNLRGSIRGLSAAQAAWRPGAGRHNAWEIVVHAAYWKYVARRRLTGEKRGSFQLAGSNWFARPGESAADERSWKRDVALLASTHEALRETVALLTPDRLDRPAPGGRETVLALVTGIAAHDLYHAGQIQLLKRLQPDPDH